jgi:ubiquinone/menaquinone biosynthesis C-methylase UbiE
VYRGGEMTKTNPIRAEHRDPTSGEARAVLDRQRREREFHQEFAKHNADKIAEPVDMAIARATKRRWWNAYWHLYTRVRSFNLDAKRVLVVGCGLGDDAIRLAAMGAEVYAIDLSPEIVGVARARASRLRVKLTFDVMAAERLAFADNSFDAAFFVDILHHVDVSLAVAEFCRVLKPNGLVIGDELYTHGALQSIRESRFVRDVLYPRMVRYIYRTDRPYITADEHKIDQREFAIIRRALRNGGTIDYFCLGEGRLYPNSWSAVSRIDRVLMRLAGPVGRFIAGRVVFVGQLVK